MAFPPKEEFDVEVQAPPAVLVDRLMDRIEPFSLMHLFGSSERYYGQVDEGGFKTTHVKWRGMRWRGMGEPPLVVRGRFEETASGTRVRVAIELPWYVRLFLRVWFGGVGIAFAVGVVLALYSALVGTIIAASSLVTALCAWGFWRWILSRAVGRDREEITSILEDIRSEAQGTIEDV